MPTDRPFSVVKIGGALAQKPDALVDLWKGVTQLSRSHAVVVVHGAGPQMTAHARILGHEPTIVAGRRVTSDIDLRIATHVLAGEVNATVTSSAVGAGVAAVGMAALSGKTVIAKRRPPVDVDGERVDFGHVGDLESVDTALVKLLAGAFVPVLFEPVRRRPGQPPQRQRRHGRRGVGPSAGCRSPAPRHRGRRHPGQSRRSKLARSGPQRGRVPSGRCCGLDHRRNARQGRRGICRAAIGRRERHHLHARRHRSLRRRNAPGRLKRCLPSPICPDRSRARPTLPPTFRRPT